MSYTVESINDCTKKLIFNFNSIDLTKEIQSALNQKQQNTNLKGYRKGKAPMAMIGQMYGAQAENEALYNFISKEFFTAVKTEGLKTIGYPRFDKTKYESEKKNVQFEAVVEIFPVFEIKDYSSYTFTRDNDAVGAEEIESLKKRYLESKAEMKEVSNASKKLAKNDFAVFNFEGEKADGTKPENMKGKEYLLEIGTNQFIPGFEDGMIGMKKGDKKVLELTFPEGYHEESLRNQKVKFNVELLEIKEKTFPEWTDELAKEFGFESVADMGKKVTDQLSTQKKRQADEKIHQEILEKLVSENKFTVPSALVAQQRSHLENDITQNLKRSGFNDKMVEDYLQRWDGDFNKKAEFQVQSGLIIDKIANKFKIEPTEADIKEKFVLMSQQSGLELAKVEEIYGKNQNLKNNIFHAIREEKTFEKLKSQMKIKQS